MFDFDSDDMPFDDDDAYDPFYMEDEPIYQQWRIERWLMEVLLWPAKAPKPHPIDKLTWVAGNKANLAVVLTTLERDGLIRRDGDYISATKAAVSFWRLELTQAGPLR